MFKSSLKAGRRNVKVNFPGCPLYLHQSVGQQHDGSKIQREQVCDRLKIQKCYKPTKTDSETLNLNSPFEFEEKLLEQ